MTSGEWVQIMAGVGLLVALFAFPVISIWLDERRKRRAGADPAAWELIDGRQEESRYSYFHNH